MKHFKILYIVNTLTVSVMFGVWQQNIFAGIFLMFLIDVVFYAIEYATDLFANKTEEIK